MPIRGLGRRNAANIMPDEVRDMIEAFRYRSPTPEEILEVEEINMCNIRRLDPYVKKIIHVSSHTAIYTYTKDEADGQWKWSAAKASGCLLFYEREVAPSHGIVIMNRIDIDNYHQLLTPSMEFERLSPYLMFKEGDDIRCMWFYKLSDCDTVADMLYSIGHEVDSAPNMYENPYKTPSDPNMLTTGIISPPTINTGSVIFDLLNKSAIRAQAKRRYSSSGSGSNASGEGSTPNPLIPLHAPDVVLPPEPLPAPIPLKMPLFPPLNEASGSDAEQATNLLELNGGNSWKAWKAYKKLNPNAPRAPIKQQNKNQTQLPVPSHSTNGPSMTTNVPQRNNVRKEILPPGTNVVWSATPDMYPPRPPTYSQKKTNGPKSTPWWNPDPQYDQNNRKKSQGPPISNFPCNNGTSNGNLKNPSKLSNVNASMSSRGPEKKNMIPVKPCGPPTHDNAATLSSLLTKNAYQSKVNANQSQVQFTSGANASHGSTNVHCVPETKDTPMPEIKTDAQKHLLGLFSNMTFAGAGAKTDQPANGGRKY